MKSNNRIISASLFATVLFFVLILGLAACAAPATPMVDLDQYRDEACKSNMDTDFHEAYRRFENPILWTFNTSFMRNPQQPDMILGCLRYYWRDNMEQVFTGSTDGAVIVPCSVNRPNDTSGVEVITATQDMGSSAGLRQWSVQNPGDESMPGRKAIFTNGASVECPLNINNSLVDLAQTERFMNDVRTNLSSENDADLVINYVSTMTQQSTWDYPEFTAVAAVALFPTTNQEYPFISYEPREDSMPEGLDPTAYISQFGLLGPSQLYYTARFGETGYSVSQNEECSVPYNEGYFWLDFGRCEKDPQNCGNESEGTYLQFVRKQPTTVGAGANVFCRRTDIIAPSIPVMVPFYTGPATLTINFPGELYEAWFDPNAAVKPNNASVTNYSPILTMRSAFQSKFERTHTVANN